jgi:hypothetical protein
MTTKKQSEPNIKLSKIQKFYIAEHRDRDLKQLAVDIESPIGAVRAYLATLKSTEARKAAAVVDEAPPEIVGNPNTGVTVTRVDDLMGKSRRGGVTIMTEAASQVGDEHRRTHHMSKRLAKNVQEIRPKRD